MFREPVSIKEHLLKNAHVPPILILPAVWLIRVDSGSEACNVFSLFTVMRQAPIGQKENVEKVFLRVILPCQGDFVESQFPGLRYCERNGAAISGESDIQVSPHTDSPIGLVVDQG